MSTEYPWYDSNWLESYVRATALIRRRHPARLREFEQTFEVLRTVPHFQTKLIQDIFSEEDHASLKALIVAESGPKLEKHEVLRFGRLVVHDDALCTSMQAKLTDRMSEWVNEPVEPCYNFLSLYSNLGVCGVHLDAPSAKWTLDYCIEQSAPWPIHLSQVKPWPEAWNYSGPDWEAAVRNDPDNHFSSFELQEGQAIIFSGSSQWHYRDRIARPAARNFCHLAFFHFVPKGAQRLTNPGHWGDYFAIPELSDVIVRPREINRAVIA